MANKVLTIVYEEAKQVIDSAVAAVVNELHDLGHTIKEVRLMGDSGEQKLDLNTVEGVTPEAAGNPPPEPETVPEAEQAPEQAAIPPTTETGTTGAPVDEPTEPPVADPTSSGGTTTPDASATS